ncbi:hypothetical protein O0L34_g2757 [Tuta absoluta]|nr:hypothetical protein O0L34_g2757 [Tuta absoluta]
MHRVKEKVEEVDWNAVKRDGHNMFTKLIRTRDPRASETDGGLPVPGKQRLSVSHSQHVHQADPPASETDGGLPVPGKQRLSVIHSQHVHQPDPPASETDGGLAVPG